VFVNKTMPSDEEQLDFKMAKYRCVNDIYMISFVIKDKFSERMLREKLKDVDIDTVDSIVKFVLENSSEEEIGETEFSEITSVATIKRILPG